MSNQDFLAQFELSAYEQNTFKFVTARYQIFRIFTYQVSSIITSKPIKPVGQIL